jgi:hypothetical protein
MWILALLLLAPTPARDRPWPEVALELPARVPLVCEDGAYAKTSGWRGHCEARIPIAVKNVTGGSVVIQRVFVLLGESMEPKATLAHGETWKGELTVSREDRYRVLFDVRYPGWATFPLAVVEVVNPVRAKAIAACRKCRGTFGPNGLLGFDSCVCPSPDAGKRCTDGDQCVNGCMFDHFVTVGRSGLTRPVGRCARDDSHFSCKTPIPDGASKPRASWTLLTTCAD